MFLRVVCNSSSMLVVAILYRGDFVGFSGASFYAPELFIFTSLSEIALRYLRGTHNTL